MLNIARAADRERATVEIARLESLLAATRKVAVVKDQIRFHDDRYRRVHKVLAADLTEAENELARLVAIAPDDWSAEIAAMAERPNDGDPYAHPYQQRSSLTASSETENPAAPEPGTTSSTPTPSPNGDAPAQPGPADEPAPAQPAEPAPAQPASEPQP